MNQITWQGKLRQLRGEFKREWGKFTQNDRSRIEGEFERMIGQLQQSYGYSRERALDELERYWRSYGKPMGFAVNERLQRRKKRKGRQIPWVTFALGVVGLLLVVMQVRQFPQAQRRQVKPALSPSEEKRQESIRQEKERDLVDEQSWESFPASDPPASW